MRTGREEAERIVQFTCELGNFCAVCYEFGTERREIGAKHNESLSFTEFHLISLKRSQTGSAFDARRIPIAQIQKIARQIKQRHQMHPRNRVLDSRREVVLQKTKTPDVSLS